MNGIEEKITAFEQSEMAALAAFRDQGVKVAATFCRFFPVSLLAGLGLRQVRILSGATMEAETHGERLVRPDACPYCKSLLGNFMERTSIHGLVDVVVGLVTCDQMRRTLERLAADLSLPVFPLQLPATATEQAETYFVSQVRRVLADLGTYLGKTLDPGAVRKMEEHRARVGAKLTEWFLGCALSPRVMHHLGRLFAWARPETYLEFLNELAPQLPTFPARSTVLVVGGVSCEEDETLYDVIASRDFCAVPLNCTGLNAVEGISDPADLTDEDLVDGLSRAAFRSPACIRKRPNHEVYDRIEEILEKTHASGIVLKTLSFCDLWFSEKERMRRHFDVPLLTLDTGYGSGIQERARSRLEAFLETLE